MLISVKMAQWISFFLHQKMRTWYLGKYNKKREKFFTRFDMQETRKMKYWIQVYPLMHLSVCLRGYCTPGPYFWRLCAFSQKIKQLRTKYSMDLVRNVPRNSKITVLLQWRPLLWSYSQKCAKINIFHVLNHKSITTWVSEIPMQ